ncbi:MAG: hypothetical protein ACI96M_000413 [Candidatus Azotimanducaceae bacterium]|jgi:hypothetical protein
MICKSLHMNANLGGMLVPLKEGQGLQGLIAEIAEACVSLAPEELQVALDYSEASLAAVDNAISLLWSGRPPERLFESTAVWGSYVGETLRRLLGGRWVAGETDVDLPMLEILEQPHAMQASPYGKVSRRLENGMEDSISDFCRVLKEMVRLAIVCPETYAKELANGHISGVRAL